MDRTDTRRGAINIDPTHVVLVVVDDSEVEVTMQLSFVSGLARRGALVQLTTDNSRAEAYRFYEVLGLVAPHEGLKPDL